jgi:hypothetical protein
MKCRRLAGAIVAVLLLPVSLPAQEITPAPDGTLSIRAVDVPLGRLLDALRTAALLERIVLLNDVGGRGVTLALGNVTPRRALIAALESAGVDYVLGETRLVAGDAAFRGLAVTAHAPAFLEPLHDPNGDGLTVREDKEPQQTVEASPIETARFEMEARSRAIMLEQELQPPPVRAAPGGLVMLPFPGPDGVTPEIVVIQGGPAAQLLPFPVSTAPQPALIAPLPADPRLRELIEALYPGRGTGR